MSERITAKHVYDHAPEVVYAQFTDAAAVVAKHEALGARDVEVDDWHVDDDGAALVFEREVPVQVPGFLKRFLQPWNEVTQRERWRRLADDHYHADVDVEIDNVPVRIAGTLDLRATETGCVNDVALTISSSVPLVGGKLAAFIAGDTKRLIAAEHRYLVKHLR